VILLSSEGFQLLALPRLLASSRLVCQVKEVKEKVGDGTPYCGYEVNAFVDRVQGVSVYDCIDN